MCAAPRRESPVRAILAGVGITAVVALLLVWIPQWLLVRLPAPGREGRALLATAWTLAALAALGRVMWVVSARAARRPEDA